MFISYLVLDVFDRFHLSSPASTVLRVLVSIFYIIKTSALAHDAQDDAASRCVSWLDALDTYIGRR